MKNHLIRTWLIAFIGACVVVAMDTVFAHACPRSFMNLQGIDLAGIVTTILNNAVITFNILFLLFFIYYGAGKYLFFLLFFIAIIFYLVSWATFLIVGEFMGLEGLRFTISNFKDILWMISQMSPVYLVILTVLFVLPLGVIFLARETGGRLNDFTKKKIKNRRQFIVCASIWSASFVMALFWIAHPPPKQKFDLMFRTSPQATFFFHHPLPEIAEKLYANRNLLKTQMSPIISWEEYIKEQTEEALPVPVILIVIESLRYDLLENDKVMPNVYALKQDGTSFKAYTSSNQTDYAWPAILASQYPLRRKYHYYYPSRMHFPRVMVYDVLKKAGFATAIFSAQNERWGGMFNFLNTGTLDVFFNSDFAHQGQYVPIQDPGFAKYVERFGLVGKIDDAVVVSQAMRWVNALRTSKFFIAFNFQRPHFPYTWPASLKPPFPYCEPQPWLYNRNMTAGMKNRYFNALRYTDQQIGAFIRMLKEKGLYDRSIIIVTGDHGEAFYEHYTPVHGNDLFNETTLTDVVIKGSGNKIVAIPEKIPELIDIAPTIIDMVGLSSHPGFQGVSWLGHGLLKKPVFVSNNSPISNEDAIVEGGWKLIKDNRDGRIFFYNLKEDPFEKQNLSGINSVIPRKLLYELLFWRYKQIEYYASAELTKKYYPPKFYLYNQK